MLHTADEQCLLSLQWKADEENANQCPLTIKANSGRSTEQKHLVVEPGL
jgi:hypothetical protein